MTVVRTMSLLSSLKSWHPGGCSNVVGSTIKASRPAKSHLKRRDAREPCIQSNSHWCRCQLEILQTVVCGKMSILGPNHSSHINRNKAHVIYIVVYSWGQPFGNVLVCFYTNIDCSWGKLCKITPRGDWRPWATIFPETKVEGNIGPRSPVNEGSYFAQFPD